MQVWVAAGFFTMKQEKEDPLNIFDGLNVPKIYRWEVVKNGNMGRRNGRGKMAQQCPLENLENWAPPSRLTS